MGRNDTAILFRKLILQNDALLMKVSYQGAQEYIGHIEKIYSQRFEGPRPYGREPLSFVGSAGGWGNIDLKDGERAIVFLKYLTHSNRYYQESWHAHLSIVSFDDNLHAVANWNLLDERTEPWGPEQLRNAAFHPDLSKPWQVAIPFSLVEQHIVEELAHHGEQTGT